MANTEIDSLSLNIEINGLSEKDIKNLESLAESIAKLQRNLRKLELSRLKEIKIPANLKGLTGVEYNIKPINADTIENINGFEDVFEGVEETFVKAADQIDESMLKINKDVKPLKANAKDTASEINKVLKPKKPTINKQLNQIEKSLRRIKTVAFIKLIRGAIQGFIRGLQQGIQNLATFDDKFNESMSIMATAKTQSFNALALMVEPLITTIAPFMEMLSQTMQNIGNTMSQISASMRGLSTYTKLNANYAEDYAKSLQKANKFSFDTFESIDTSSSMFTTETIDESEVAKYEGIAEFMQNIKTALYDVLDIVKQIGNIITPIFEKISPLLTEISDQTKGAIEDIAPLILEIVNLLVPVIELLLDTIGKELVDSMGMITDAVGNIFKMIMPLINVIVSKLLPAIIRISNAITQPLFDTIELLLPIVTDIIQMVVEILEPIIEVISSLIEYISIILEPINNIIKTILSLIGNQLRSYLKVIFDLLKPIITVLNVISEVVGYIVKAFESLFNADFEGFKDNMLKAFKGLLSGILKILASIIDGIVNAFIGLINVIIANDVVKSIVSFFGGNWQGITWRSNLADNVPSFANGGVVGEIWQMNEYGNAEMLYSANSGGNTSVITQEQLTNAFENAIFNTGLLQAIQESGSVYLDGKEIAQSNRFKNEINRTNPNLNIR